MHVVPKVKSMHHPEMHFFRHILSLKYELDFGLTGLEIIGSTEAKKMTVYCNSVSLLGFVKVHVPTLYISDPGFDPGFRLR